MHGTYGLLWRLLESKEEGRTGFPRRSRGVREEKEDAKRPFMRCWITDPGAGPRKS